MLFIFFIFAKTMAHKVYLSTLKDKISMKPSNSSRSENIKRKYKT